MRSFLAVLGTLSLIAGLLGFLVAKSAVHQAVGASLLVVAAAALAGAGVIEAVNKLTKAMTDRPTAAFAAEQVNKELAALRAEFKTLRYDLDGRREEIRRAVSNSAHSSSPSV